MKRFGAFRHYVVLKVDSLTNGSVGLVTVSHGGLNPNRFAKDLLGRAPACQWLINHAHRFQFVTGDTNAIFRRPVSELIGQHVSVADNPRGRWTAHMDLLFSGGLRLERLEQTASGYSLVHIPILGEDQSVLYAAGFAYAADQSIPSVPELEMASLLTLFALEAERTRTSRFLHDVVAQCLSGAGLQIELLRMELEGRGFEMTDRGSAIQRSLEEALNHVRQFSAGDAGAARQSSR